jgi:hypothetical protein
VLIFVITCTAYFHFYHYPTTRASAFNYDSGWVLMSKLAVSFGDNALDRASGINALRFKALNGALPQSYEMARAFRNIDDSAPPETKAYYRAVYNEIMRMSKSELERFVISHPVPDNFMLWAAVVPIYYYVGLAEGDALARLAYFEFVLSNPLLFARDVFRAVFRNTVGDLAQPFVPTNPAEGDLKSGKALANGYREYVSSLPGAELPIRYWSPGLILWEPGIQAFGSVRALVPHRYTEYALFSLLVVGVAFRRFRGVETKFVAAISGTLACFILANSIVYFMRDKEAIAIWPLTCLLWAISIKWIVNAILALANASGSFLFKNQLRHLGLRYLRTDTV